MKRVIQNTKKDGMQSKSMLPLIEKKTWSSVLPIVAQGTANGVMWTVFIFI
jgi:hypothetical protein